MMAAIMLAVMQPYISMQ